MFEHLRERANERTKKRHNKVKKWTVKSTQSINQSIDQSVKFLKINHQSIERQGCSVETERKLIHFSMNLLSKNEARHTVKKASYTNWIQLTDQAATAKNARGNLQTSSRSVITSRLQCFASVRSEKRSTVIKKKNMVRNVPRTN